MAQDIKAIKGVHDVMPPDIRLWHALEDAAKRVFGAYGYDEIRPPVIEKTDLFVRSIGKETDVVEKEMYSFVDKGEDAITLRPEGTAGVVRAYVEHGLGQTDPAARFWYLGPMYRRERPQAGRQRQFYQLGVELFGVRAPRVDAEVLVMLRDYLGAVGLEHVAFHVSSLGDAKCRPPYRAELQGFLRGIADALCEDCRRRIETNPLRVLDCKKEGCRAATAKAPLLLDRLCEECKTHWDEVRRALDLLKVGIVVDPRIVRGLDYYVRTSFELVYTGEGLGSQNAIGGGGRYDGLVKQLGGPDTPGVGFALGMERMFLALQAQKGLPPKPGMVFLAPMGPAAGDRAMSLARELRASGLKVEMDYEAKPKGLGNVLDKANRRGAAIALILGDAELAKGVATVKTLATGEQVERALDATLAGWLTQKVEGR